MTAEESEASVTAAAESKPAPAAAEEKKMVLADSLGHIMVHLKDVGADWVCQKCKKTIEGSGYTCVKCTENGGVKLCDSCAENMYKRVKCGKPEAHLLCGYLHDDLCKVHPEYLEGYACDNCCEFGPFEAVFHCEKCEYDLCPLCAGSLMVC